LMEEQDTTSSTEERIKELQTVLEDNASVLVTKSVSRNDEYTTNPPLMDEQDTLYGVSLETNQVCSNLTLI